MDELDDEQHMPEGVESAVWQRLVQTRREKVESEQQVNWLLQISKRAQYRIQITNRIQNLIGSQRTGDFS